MSIHQLSINWANYLARELNVDNKQEARMAFGLELFLGEITKLFILLGLALLLSIFQEVLIITITASLLRLASGGEHCDEYYRCLIGGTICFLLLGGAAHYLNPLTGPYDLILIAGFTAFIAAAVVWKYAPGDTANKPITSDIERRKFKRLSLLVVLVFFLFMSILIKYHILTFVVLPMAFGILEQVFTVTPWGYGFIHHVDVLLSFGKRG